MYERMNEILRKNIKHMQKKALFFFFKKGIYIPVGRNLVSLDRE